MYDHLIVESGLYGATLAHFSRKTGKTCLVIVKRPHMGENLYCENIEGINVHFGGGYLAECKYYDMALVVDTLMK